MACHDSADNHFVSKYKARLFPLSTRRKGKEKLTLMNNNTAMQYMIIERFHPGKVKDMYQRFEEKGRMLPYDVP